MKVLITTDWYPPAVNGVVTSVVNLIRQLQERGADVRVLTLSEDGAYHRKGNIIYLPSVDMSRIYPGARAFFWPGCRSGTAQEFIRWHPDIVHSQCEFSTFLSARKIARACGCPQVHTYHTLYEEYIHYVSPSASLGKRGARMLTARVCRTVQHVIVPSEKIENLLRQYHVRSPITCIPTGVEVRRFSETGTAEERQKLRARYGISEEEVALLYAGRLATEKNLDELLALFFRCSCPANKLVLVGDGPYRRELENIVRQLKIADRVVFTGMVPPQNMPDYYRMGDIFVSSSRSETQGLTYFEAMASGLPLLCRRDPCLDRVLVPGENGFAYDTAQQYAKWLRVLTGSSAMRRTLGNRGKEIVQRHYSAEVFAENVLKVYRQVLGMRRLPGGSYIYGTAAEQIS